MKPADLRLQVEIEQEALLLVVTELIDLYADVTNRNVTLRERAAAATFLAQFYTGIENILKRISYYCGVPLPSGETWHVELFQRFCAPSHPKLPALFDTELAALLAPYRRFRHVAIHSYAFQLEWTQMQKGIAQIQDVYQALDLKLKMYFDSLTHDAGDEAAG